MNELPNPLTPADCELREFPFMPLEVKRLLSSETWVLGTGDERAAAITLWLESWHQVPAASLPDNDRMLAHLSQSKTWKKSKDHALRGWIRCSDGRLYHAVVAEKALEAWLSKLVSSLSGSAGNAKRWGIEVDTESVRRKVIEAVELLRAIAPQSEWLVKKQVKNIVLGSPPESPRESPPDDKKIAPRSKKTSPPESPPDRNREGEGEGELTDKTKGTVIVGGKPPRGGRDDFTPKDAGDWQRYFREKHGVELDATSLHDRKKAWPIFTAWVNAGVSVSQMDAAVAKAKAEAKGSIAFLPGYADAVLASLSRPVPQPRLNPDEQRRAISERNAAEWLAGDSESDPNVIDMEH
ncbi:DUF1376 domain-containing protein [Paraburkholderia saeva]|uniref:DUF1376 domain-containing protein n=1 Tax=Paraburkholderia saeva TaxID=2777537 RepID=UPI001D2B4131|nr:DUF1376 domain-containing protein [Paraburkholderia saeva]CAG4887864.1 hypothetical protein R52603_00527 [Paraburkholderia saeva]